MIIIIHNDIIFILLLIIYFNQMQYKEKAIQRKPYIGLNTIIYLKAMQVQTMSFAGQHTEEQIRYTTKDISRGQIYNVVFKNDMHFTPLPLSKAI